MKTTDCIICGSKEKRTIVEQQFHDKYLALLSSEYNEKERKWVECESCGFIYHDPLLDEDDTKLLYNKFRDSSFRDESPDEYFDKIIGIQPEKSENFHKVEWLHDSVEELLPEQPKVLDVGCGGGVFLYALRNKIQDCYVFGLEPTESFAKLAARKLSCQVFVGSFEGVIYDGEYDLITCNHVLEHADDPIIFFRNLYSNLKKNGYLYIEVPSVNDFKDKTLEPDNDRFLMQHLWFFSPEILDKIASDAGFSSYKLETRKTVIGKNDLVAIYKK